MGIPNVSVKKVRAGASVNPSANDGILAIVAWASAGPTLQPGIFSNQALLTQTYQFGPLPEMGSYELDVAGRPVLAVNVAVSVPGSFGAVTTNVLGTSVVTAGTTHPFEHYSVKVTVVNGGTVGTAGITYTYSLDGGTTVSAVQALGTTTTLTIPNSGVSFALAAGTLLAGDNWSVFTERPQLNNADIATVTPVLNNTRLPWEGVLIDCEYLSGTVGLLDTWLSGREKNGQFNFALVNTRYLLEPTPSGESAATYAAAMITLTGNDASERVCVGADGGHVASQITGLNLKRPTTLALAGMAMGLTPNIGIDPAYVGNGPVSGYQIDVGGNPNDWDEGVYQSLDAQRLVTLRSFAPGGPQGVYITNANVLIPNGSQILWLQLLRVVNKACTIAWQTLNTQLSKGVRTVLDQTTGALNMDERDAQSIEGIVNPVLRKQLKGQVTGALFILNRDDDLTVEGAPVNATVQIQGLFYIKGFQVAVSLVKEISVPGGGV